MWILKCMCVCECCSGDKTMCLYCEYANSSAHKRVQNKHKHTQQETIWRKTNNQTEKKCKKKKFRNDSPKQKEFLPSDPLLSLILCVFFLFHHQPFQFHCIQSKNLCCFSFLYSTYFILFIIWFNC